MSLIEAISSPKSLHQNSSYEERTIDIGLLVKDYLYIYNYLTADTREDIQHTSPMYAKALNVSKLQSLQFLDWTIYSNEYEEFIFSDMTLSKESQIFLASISDMMLFKNSDESHIFREFCIFRHFNKYAEKYTVFSQKNIEETVSERLFIIEDYINNKVKPKRCENLKCRECIFEQTCSKRYEYAEIPF